MKARVFFLSLLCLMTCASCASPYRVEGARAALAGGRTASVGVAPGDSGDELALSTVEEELSARGFSIVDRHSAHLIVTMADTWRWDEIMFLRDLDLTFTEPATGAVKAQARYRHSQFHGYPTQTSVVRTLFKNLEARGVFAQ
jgi:hypothetical protein